MSKFSSGILGALAASFAIGTLHIAMAYDLGGAIRRVDAPSASAAEVNRLAKSDRLGVAPAAGATRTIALRTGALENTSVLVRLPAAQANDAGRARRSPAPELRKSPRRTLACEVTVSTLTEIARQLEPGRCLA